MSGWLDNFQNGGKAPKYVESANDPRYKAYQDSLNSYTTGNQVIHNIRKILEKVNSKDGFHDYGDLTTDYIKNPYKNPDYGSNIKGQNPKGSGNRYENFVKEELDPVSWKNELPIAEQLKKLDKNKVLPFRTITSAEMPNLSIYKKPNQPYIVNRPQIQPIDNQLQPATIHNSNNIETSPMRINSQFQAPKYYDVQDIVHSQMGDNTTDYQWYPANGQPLQELAPEPLNSRKMIPRYQDGGQIFNSRQKRGVELQLKDFQNQKKDEKELKTKGTIKNPKSVKYSKGVQQEDVHTYTPQSTLSKTWEVLTHPMTAAGYAARNQDLPDNFSRGEINAHETATNLVNPFFYADEAKNFVKNVATGHPVDASMNALNVLPLASEYKALGNLANKAGRFSKDIGELVISDVKDTAKLVNQLGQVSTKPGVVLGNTTNMENPLKVFDTIEEGSNTIQNSLSNRINLLKTDEGRKRLIQQEYEYLKKLGFNEQGIQRQAEINADNRISELQHTQVFGNVNANTIEGVDKNLLSKNIMSQEPNTAQLRYNLIENGVPGNNAHYVQSNPVPIEDNFMDDHLKHLLKNYGKYKTEDSFMNTINLIKHPTVGGYEAPGDIALGLGFPKSTAIADHEIQHALQRSRKLNIDDELKTLERKAPENLSEDEKHALNYFITGSKGKESSAFLAEARTSMKEAGLIKNDYDHISPDLVKKSMEYFKKNPQKILTREKGYIPFSELSNTRIFDIHAPTEFNFKLLSDSFNKLPGVVPGAIGVGAVAGASQLEEKKNGGWLSKYEQGGVIKDDRGQWDHPGEITEIGSPHITMKNVSYPVLGVSKQTGEKKLMLPEKNYKFANTKQVVEYPMVNKNWLDGYE